jgi:hypothetical protein
VGGVLTTRARGAASIPSPTACPRCRRGRATTKFKFGCGRVVHLCRQCAQRFVLILSEKINILEHTHDLQHDPSMRHTEQDPLPQGWACGAPPRSDPPRTMAPDASEHTSSDCSMSGQSHHLRSPSPAQIAAPSPQPVSGTTAPGPSTHLSWPHTPRHSSHDKIAITLHVPPVAVQIAEQLPASASLRKLLTSAILLNPRARSARCVQISGTRPSTMGCRAGVLSHCSTLNRMKPYIYSVAAPFARQPWHMLLVISIQSMQAWRVRVPLRAPPMSVPYLNAQMEAGTRRRGARAIVGQMRPRLQP